MSFVRLQQCYGIERELLEIKYATRNEANVVVSPKNRLKSNNCSISFLLVYGFTTLCCRHWNELGSRSVRAELFTKIRQKEILVSETINKGIDWLLCEFITFSAQLSDNFWRGHGNNEVWTSRLFVCERLWKCNRYTKRLDTFSLGKFFGSLGVYFPPEIIRGLRHFRLVCGFRQIPERWPFHKSLIRCWQIGVFAMNFLQFYILQHR